MNPTDVEDCKEDQQRHQPNTEIPDILRFQAFEFYWLIDPLIDLVDTVCHDFMLKRPKSRKRT